MPVVGPWRGRRLWSRDVPVPVAAMPRPRAPDRLFPPPSTRQPTPASIAGTGSLGQTECGTYAVAAVPHVVCAPTTHAVTTSVSDSCEDERRRVAPQGNCTIVQLNTSNYSKFLLFLQGRSETI